MLNTRSLDRFQPLNEHLLRPIYDDYAFGAIPATVERLLTGATSGPLLPPDCFGGAYPQPRTVVLFLIDSFGWRFWQRYARRFDICGRIEEAGTLTPISALFPSTTTASITTLNLGVLPTHHALYEWFVYIPAYGAVIQTLPFMPVGVYQLDACLDLGCDPAHLLAHHDTFYQRLGRQGVRAVQFLSQEYTTSAYNRVASAGAEVAPFASLEGGLTAIKEAITHAAQPSYLGFYWDRIDAAGHDFGPGSPEHEAAIAGFWRTFERVFANFAHPETLFLFTADHGQVATDPAATIRLNEAIPDFTSYLRRAPSGEPITPNGSPRDVFLHIQPEHLDAASAGLRALLGDQATLLTTDAALAAGLFGPLPASDEFRRRLGDLLILPHGATTVWWSRPGPHGPPLIGQHGGLTAPEMQTIFAATDHL